MTFYVVSSKPFFSRKSHILLHVFALNKDNEYDFTQSVFAKSSVLKLILTRGVNIQFINNSNRAF